MSKYQIVILQFLKKELLQQAWNSDWNGIEFVIGYGWNVMLIGWMGDNAAFSANTYTQATRMYWKVLYYMFLLKYWTDAAFSNSTDNIIRK